MNLKLFGLSASLLKSTLIVIVNVCENLANQNTWIVTCHLVNRVTIFENNMQCRNQVCAIQFSELLLECMASFGPGFMCMLGFRGVNSEAIAHRN